MTKRHTMKCHTSALLQSGYVYRKESDTRDLITACRPDEDPAGDLHGRAQSPRHTAMSCRSHRPLASPHEGKTIDRRAVCGRSARTVRREGGPNPIGPPYPDFGQRCGTRLQKPPAEAGG